MTAGQTAKQQKAGEQGRHDKAELPQAAETGGREDRAHQLAGERSGERLSADAGGGDPQPEEAARHGQPHAPGHQTQQKTLELSGRFGSAAAGPPGRPRYR